MVHGAWCAVRSAWCRQRRDCALLPSLHIQAWSEHSPLAPEVFMDKLWNDDVSLQSWAGSTLPFLLVKMWHCSTPRAGTR